MGSNLPISFMGLWLDTDMCSGDTHTHTHTHTQTCALPSVFLPDYVITSGRCFLAVCVCVCVAAIFLRYLCQPTGSLICLPLSLSCCHLFSHYRLSVPLFLSPFSVWALPCVSPICVCAGLQATLMPCSEVLSASPPSPSPFHSIPSFCLSVTLEMSPSLHLYVPLQFTLA